MQITVQWGGGGVGDVISYELIQDINVLDKNMAHSSYYRCRSLLRHYYKIRHAIRKQVASFFQTIYF